MRITFLSDKQYCIEFYDVLKTDMILSLSV